MSVARALIVVAFVASTWTGASAQSEQDDRFFSDKEETKKTKKKTLWQGSITSTTFLFHEQATISDPLPGAAIGAENASRVDRVFTDLRLQADGRHLSGGDWDSRTDARARVTTSGTDGGSSFQSGTLGGREYELREMYLKRGGDKTDMFFGRQFVLDMAAIKIDGVRAEYRKNDQWKYLGFAGAHPARGSRSIETDYPMLQPIDPMAEATRVVPIAGGLGAAYRFEKFYGALGAVGILPRGNDRIDGSPEQTRAYLTANGYYRRSQKLDLYHFLVFDVEGANRQSFTNISVGVNYRPAPVMRVTASYDQIDTETLNVIAQTQLENPDIVNTPQVQNNIEVNRISSRSARVGVSVSFKENRYEVSTAGTLRQRPEIIVPTNDPAMEVTIDAAQSAEVLFRIVDRRSIKNTRIQLMFVSMFGVGDTNINNSTSNVYQLSGSKEIKDGLGMVELAFTYLASDDENRDAACLPADLLSCYGTSAVRSYSVSGTYFHRIKPDWLLIAGAEIGRQTLTTTEAGAAVAQAPILITSGFARIAYRF